MFEINKKYEKHTPEMAIWCNEKGYYIVQEKDGYYIREHIKTLEELKAEKIEELKNSRKIYKQSVLISGIDLETICNKQNLRDNIILSIHPFNEKDTEIFKNEIEFISKFYDEKKAEIKNAIILNGIMVSKKLKKINTKFVKE